MQVTPAEAAAALVRHAAREQEALRAEEAAVRARLPAVVGLLRDRFGVARVVLFGSLAWGAFHAEADVDLATEGLAEEEVGLAMAEASEATGRTVELFRLEELPETFRRRILTKGRELT